MTRHRVTAAGAQPTRPPGITTTSLGGDTYTAVMSNGARYTVRQEGWSVRTDYYLDTLVDHLPELVRGIEETGNRLQRVLEIGVARGVLAIGIALLTADDTHIVGIDIEEGAAALVSDNARVNGVADRIEVRIGDLFDPVREGETFDLILGELPFIPVDPALQRRYVDEGHASEILNVSGGPDGRQLVDALLTQGPGHLNAGGALLLIQPSFIGIGRTMALLAEHGVHGSVVFSREWRLDDTVFTRQIRGYIEALNPTAFTKNDKGEDVFHLTIIVGVKE